MSDEKIIIRYLDGEMTEDEMLAFEKEISGNPGLAEEVEKLRELQNMAGKAMKRRDDPEENLDPGTREEIRQAVIDFKEGRDIEIPEEIKETIEGARQAFEYKRENSQEAPDMAEPGLPRSNIRQIRRIWFTAAAVIVLAIIVTILFLKPNSSKPSNDLYTKYYTEYPVSSELSELSRSDDDLLFAIKVYEAGDYDRAIILFEMLQDSSTHGAYPRFYMGHAYLHINLTDRAIEAFREILDEDAGQLEQATRWYLALAYLKAGNASLSTEQLKQIDASDSPYRSEARRLLRDLQ